MLKENLTPFSSPENLSSISVWKNGGLITILRWVGEILNANWAEKLEKPI